MATGPNRPADTAVRPREEHAAAQAGPVFVDASGRRRRRLRRVSLIAAVVVDGYTVVLGIGVLGGVVPPNVLLPIGGAPAAPSVSGPPATTGAAGAGRNSGAPSGAAKTATATAPGVVPNASASGATPAPASSGTAAVSPVLSASPSATARKPTAPPGQASRSATATATGHGH